jgi:hypothetical protein
MNDFTGADIAPGGKQWAATANLRAAQPPPTVLVLRRWT